MKKIDLYRVVRLIRPVALFLLVLTGFQIHGSAQTGPLDHFTWSAIGTPQSAGLPISAAIGAFDINGNADANFNGTVNLASLAVGPPPTVLLTEVESDPNGVELSNVSQNSADVSGWTVFFYDNSSWPAPKMTFTFPAGTVCPAGAVFAVMAAIPYSGSFPTFNTGANLSWFPAQTVAVLLVDAAGNPVDFFCEGQAFPGLISQPFAISSAVWSGPACAADNSDPTYQRVGHANDHNAADWIQATGTFGTSNPNLALPFLSPIFQLPVVPASVTFTNGQWNGQVALATGGTNVVLQADDANGHSGVSNPFNVLAPPALGLQIVSAANKATPGPLGPGGVTIPQPLANDLIVSLSSSLPSEITVPATVLIAAGTTNGVFWLTNFNDGLVTGPEVAIISASAPRYQTASSPVTNFDGSSPVLSITGPSAAYEGGTYVGTVSSTVAPASNVLVNLISSQPARLQTPGAVTLPAGRTSAAFVAIIPKYNGIDGNATVTVVAAVPGWTSGPAAVLVVGDTHTSLSVGLPNVITAGYGVDTGAGSVSISGTLPTNLVVTLTNDAPAKLQTPATVTIPAGQTSAKFDLTFPGDTLMDGNRFVTVSATAPGFTGGQWRTYVIDNELSTLALSALPSGLLVGQPFTLTVNAENASGSGVNYSGSATLSATNDAGVVTVQPAVIGPFTNGVWSGLVRLTTPGPGAVLTARDSLGHSGTSGPAGVVPGASLTMPVSDITYDPLRQLVDVAVQANATSNADYVVYVNPATGVIGGKIGIGANPGILAISSDSQFLYVARQGTGGVARVNLAANVVDLTFNVGSAAGFYPYEMAVPPGTPHSLVAWINQGQGLALYVDGVRSPQTLGPDPYNGDPYDLIFYGSPTNFYSVSQAGYGVAFVNISPQGLNLSRAVSGYAADYVYAGGLLFCVTGDLYDPVNLRHLGAYPTTGLVAPDPAAGRVYFLAGGILQAYDICTFSLLGQVTLPNSAGTANKMLSCGTNGLAIATSTGLLLVQPSLIPQPAPADISVSQSVAGAGIVGTNFVYSITVSNAGPALAPDVRLADILPADAVFISATNSVAAGSVTDGLPQCDLGPLAPGTSIATTLVIQPATPGAMVNLAWAIGDGLNLTNSTSRLTNTVSFGSILPAVTRLWRNAESLAYDPSRNVLWFSTVRSGGALDTGVYPLHLDTGLAGNRISLNYSSTKIALSADLQNLYAAYFAPGDPGGSGVYGPHVSQVSLSNGVVQRTFSTPGVIDMTGIAAYPGDIVIAQDGVNANVAIYENGGTIRATPSARGAGLLRVNPSISTRLYLFWGAGPSDNFVCLDTSTSPISILPGDDILGIPSTPTSPAINDIRYGNGYIFSNIGQVADAEALTNITRLAAAGLVETDPASGLVFFLANIASGWILSAFDMNTLLPVWSSPVPGIIGNPSNLTRCGNGIVAFQTDDDQLFIVNTAQLPHPLQSTVALTLTSNASETTTNVPVTFTTQVSNLGPGPESDVTLTNQFSGNATILSMVTSQGTVTKTGDTVICDFGSLQAGATAYLQVVATLTQGGMMTNLATATPSLPNTQVSNNFTASVVEFDIPPNSDVSVSQLFPASPGASESNFVCTVVVSNAGPDAATNVTVIDSVLAGATLLSATPSQGTVSVSGASVGGNLGVINAGSSATLTLILSPCCGGFVENTVLAYNDNQDPETINNQSLALVSLVNTNGRNLVTELPVPAIDIAYDPSNQVIVASAPASAGAYGNSIVGVSATNLAVKYQIRLGSPVGRIAISDDGTRAYAAQASGENVLGADIPNRTVDLDFAINSPGAPHGTYNVEDMSVMPGSPGTLAVARGGYSGYLSAVALFDSGVQRPDVLNNLIQNASYFAIRFADASTVYTTQPGGFEAASVTPTGLTNEGGFFAGYSGEFAVDSGMVFLDDGRVFDPSTGSLIKSYPASGRVAPDLANHRVYYLTGAEHGGYFYYYVVIHAFDSDTGAELWSLPFNTFVGFDQRFISLGTNGLAFTTDANRTFVIQTSQLSQPLADVSIAVSAPSTVTAGGPVSYTFTIQNFGPATATGVLFSNALPPGTDFVSASSSVGTCSFANNTILCDVGSLAGGASETVTLNLSAPAVGPLNDSATVSLNETDYDPLNNVVVLATAVTPVPSVWAGDVTVLESATVSAITFPITLSGPASYPISFDYATTNGTAVAGIDYLAASGVVTFAPGVTSQSLRLIIILGNTAVISNRTFFLNLGGITNALSARTQAVATIVGDYFRDIQITGTNIVKPLGGFTNIFFDLTLSQSNMLPVTVQYQTVDGSAVGGIDYEPKSGSIVFPGGTTNVNLAIPVFGNTLVESNQTFFVLLSQPVNAVLTTDEAQAMIISTNPFPPLKLLGPAIQGSTISLHFNTVRGRFYQLERSLTLSPASWAVVVNQITGTGAQTSVSDPNPPASEAYYRLIQLP